MRRYWFYVKINFRNFHQIFMFWGTSFEGPKKKDEFVNQTFLINGPSFIHKKRFCKNKIFHFPAKKCKIRYQCWETKFFISKRSIQISQWQFFHRSYIFCLLVKNGIKNKNLWFLTKIYEIRKKFYRQNYLSQNDIQIYLRALLIGHVLFVLNVKNIINNEKFNFASNLCDTKKMLKIIFL